MCARGHRFNELEQKQTHKKTRRSHDLPRGQWHDGIVSTSMGISFCLCKLIKTHSLLSFFQKLTTTLRWHTQTEYQRAGHPRDLRQYTWKGKVWRRRVDWFGLFTFSSTTQNKQTTGKVLLQAKLSGGQQRSGQVLEKSRPRRQALSSIYTQQARQGVD